MEKMDGKTIDIAADNISKLKALFPEAVTEGKIDFDVLKELLGEYVEDRDERYSFTWNGKSKARMLAQTPSTGTLRPCPEESVNWETTKNIFIEGDNLEVLKLLQKSYHKKVKVICIDPPYNTGHDFVYKDDFKDNIKNYKLITGQIDGEGRNISNNPETSGRYHTDWLDMMYPRLKLARNLLKDDGVVFINIDDTEAANLRKICDEIFGEENFVANVVWEKKYAPSNDAKWLSDNHDHILIYSKNKESWRPQPLPRSEDQNQRYTNRDNDPRGVWKSSDLTVKSYSAAYDYPIKIPSGRIVNPSNGRCWVVSKTKFEELCKDGRIWFGETGDNVPSIKRFLSEVKAGVVPLTIWKHSEVGHNQLGRQEVKKLFNNKGFFDGPKPVRLINRALHIANTESNDIILDFFAGSATTAHAVMQRNTEENGKCKFIMVQLPESCSHQSEAFKAGYKTIADIGKERIRRAAAKIKNEYPEFKGDLGFKVFKLDSTNIKPWEADFETLDEKLLEDYITNIKPGRTESDILYEILLKYGLDLTLPIKEHTIAGQKVFDIGMGALIICLSDTVDLDVVEGIAGLKQELKPEIMRVVFKDSGFKDDVVKTNAVQILKQACIEDVRSL
ncbi:site-specific DNA-methyltransferase [Desulfotignum phosphitoxidans]|uniref:site-specific DNA-methyltransferase (adenine-specific) n=1 Tax=Desulfotignum phosphitoxidans DSM 13687 TaxID=1286635 RepID=S0G7M5_9BACT|nr:site-specific DNA-methyltransferase [Desulfotignum phosphitoxidans]EMS81277.1 type III restriction-modification system StyLTI enzyme [Desulfotignum phosphitoxidans DSM 13687]